MWCRVTDDDLGGGVAEGDARRETSKELAQTISKVASSGFVRGQLNQFVVVRGGNTVQKVVAHAEHAHEETHEHAVDRDVDMDLQASFAEVRALVQEAAGSPLNSAMAALEARFASDAAAIVKTASKREIDAKRATEARLKGYQGDACGSCGNFTLVRNGTCLKCDTCGGTSGCS
jgi:ribonucleoside-diphosphate reductase alpha chain